MKPPLVKKSGSRCLPRRVFDFSRWSFALPRVALGNRSVSRETCSMGVFHRHLFVRDNTTGTVQRTRGTGVQEHESRIKGTWIVLPRPHGSREFIFG